MKKLPKWISRMLSERDGTPSIKRVCFFIAVCNCVAIGVTLVAVRHANGAELAVDIAKTTLITTASAYGVTRFAENTKKPS